MNNIFDWWTFAAVIAIGLFCVTLYLHIKMSAWDWYCFWTGGPVRYAIFDALKPIARFLFPN